MINDKWMKLICNAQNISLNRLLTEKEEHIVNKEIKKILTIVVNEDLTQDDCVWYGFAYKSSSDKFRYQPCIVNKIVLEKNQQLILKSIWAFKKNLLERKLLISTKVSSIIHGEKSDKGVILCINDSKSDCRYNSDYYDFFELGVQYDKKINDELLPFFNSENIDIDEVNTKPNNYILYEYDDDNLNNKLIKLKDSYYEKCNDYMSSMRFLESDEDALKFFNQVWDTEEQRKLYCICCKLMAGFFGDDYMVVLIVPNNVRLLDDVHTDIGGLSCMFLVKKGCHQDVFNELYLLASTVAEKVMTYNLLLSFAPLYSYQEGLNVFSHESGNYFQESGLSSLESIIKELRKFIEVSYGNNAEKLLRKILAMGKILMLPWGIQNIITIIDKGFNSKYFDKETHDISTVISKLEHNIFVILAAQINSKLTLSNYDLHNIASKNVIKIGDATLKPEDILNKYINESILPIPPFNCESIYSTVAVLFGLHELIRNACASVFSEGARLYFTGDEPLLYFSVDRINNKDVAVVIKNKTRKSLKKFECPTSIIKIKKLEEKLYQNKKAIVQTNLEVNKNEKVLVSTWKYFFETNPLKPSY